MGKMIVLAFLLLVFGVVAVLASALPDLRPVQEPLGEWFKRSGSILLVFSLSADAILASLLTTLRPGEKTVTVGHRKAEALLLPYVVVSTLAVIATVAGTVISGYGDLLL